MTRGGSFTATLREKGLHAAIEERAARWGDYGPSPLLRDSAESP